MTALDDCFLHDRDRLRHNEALTILRDGLMPLDGEAETLARDDALERVLATPLVAPFDLPNHTNAAVDGYAFRYGSSEPLRVVQRITAGAVPSPLRDGEAARIFTGAVMPAGADTVAMQEDCKMNGKTVLIPQIHRGANVRMRGEDVRTGQQVLSAGKRLDPADIATAAAFGVHELYVRPKVRLTIFSSGNEVRDGDAMETGQVFDANRPLLSALSRKWPVRIADGGILSDDKEAIENALLKASTTSDLIITTGGASRGEEDHMLSALDSIGERKAWQIAVKPGRPLMFGRIGDTAYLGLPGNPVAACVCFLLYARPVILRLAGAAWQEPKAYAVPSSFTIESKPDRREFLRGSIENGRAKKFDRDGSGLISSLRESDGLIEVPEKTTRIDIGDPVAFLPWNSFD